MLCTNQEPVKWSHDIHGTQGYSWVWKIIAIHANLCYTWNFDKCLQNTAEAIIIAPQPKQIKISSFQLHARCLCGRKPRFRSYLIHIPNANHCIPSRHTGVTLFTRSYLDFFYVEGAGHDTSSSRPSCPVSYCPVSSLCICCAGTRDIMCTCLCILCIMYMRVLTHITLCIILLIS